MSGPTKQEREIVKRMDSIRALLKQFGLQLRGIDPGVFACDSQYRTYDFGQHEWEWLEPILRKASTRCKHSHTNRKNRNGLACVLALLSNKGEKKGTQSLEEE